MNEPEPLRSLTPQDDAPSTSPPPDRAATPAPTNPLSPSTITKVERLAQQAQERHGRFIVSHLHAKGGLGEVYVAEDDELDRKVAFKRIQGKHLNNADAQRRFVLEAAITAKLEHPGIVPMYGLVKDADGHPCYAMRFIEGESRRKAEQAIKDLDFALKQPAAEVPGLLDIRVRALLKEQQLPAAVESAAKMKSLAGDDPSRLYDAACAYALCAGANNPAADAARLANECADEAMGLLKQAVAKGYKDIAHLKKDDDLKSLREREDFRKLVKELQQRWLDGLLRDYAWPLLWGQPVW